MKAHKKAFSIRLLLIFTILFGGLSVSAVTFADSLLTPLGLASEGSILASIFQLPSKPSAPVRANLDVPVVTTDNGRYLAGETAVINGAGYAPGQVVTLQIVHSDGTAEAGGGHEATSVQADAAGNFSWNWPVGRDAAGPFFHLYVDGVLADKLGRVANIRTDKNDYQPGETAQLSLEGFDPGERITLQVTHLNGQNAGAGHEPFEAFADSDGKATTEWYVNPDDSLGEIFGLSAIGASSNIATYTSFTDATVTIVDDGGPDDNPGQKDLTFLEINDAIVNNRQAVRWGWDDLRWTGNNTGDACVLYDNDADGFANFALCVTISQTVTSPPPTFQLYTCGDTRTDRCDQPAVPVANQGSTGTASIIDDIDPFRLNPAHQTNDCNGTDCVNDDSVAAVSVLLTDVGGANSRLTNVCSYPSGQPNSDPSDCILNPNNGRLTIIKSATPNDGTQFTFTASAPSAQGVSSWSVNGSGTAANQVSYAAGSTLDLTETVPAAFDLTGVSCFIQTNPVTATGTFSDANNRIDNISIQAGLETICTFTNGPANGTLIVNKTLVNDNGGTQAVTAFSYKVNNGVDVPFEADASNSHTVPPGSYTVVENAAAGYTTTYNNCTNVNVPAGGTATCTITNDDQAPSLTLNKIVTNDNGGASLESAWTLTANGGSAGTLSGPGAAGGTDVVSPSTFQAGTYALSESGPAGYSASVWSCTGTGTQNGANITVALGQSAVCSITNDDIAPQLTIIKHVINDNGGTAVAADFTLDSGGTSDSPDDFAGAESPGVVVTLNQGSYSVGETGPSGYAASYSADCSGSISVGESKTCTVTNDDIAPQLTVIKHVINDNGGTASAANFTMNVTGTNVSTPSFSGAESPGTTVTLDQGAYSVDENSFAGYAKSLGANCSGNIAVGETKTCTITNNDIAPKLTITKIVTNDDGGNAVVADFPLFINGNAVTSGVENSLSANVLYTATETNLTGYTPSAWSGDCTAGGTITLQPGDVKSCSITNDDIAPTLKLVKNVTTDNGGTATANDWTLSAAAGDPNDDRNFNNAGGSGIFTTVYSNAGYDLSESGPSGYTASVWSCTGGTLVGSVITLNEGETNITCSITNDDNAPSLTLLKQVVNDNGGTATSDMWTLTAAGYDPQSPDAGTYQLSESNGPSGYTQTSLTCSNSGAAQVTSVTLGLGESVTCTFVNDDVAPQLTVIKHVINDNGGSAVAADFTLDSGGTDDTPDDFAGSETGTLVTLDAGSYNVTEIGPSGYSASFSADCSGSIAVGESKTCTVNNDDQAGKLIVIKHVVNDNGGQAEAGDFTLDAGGTNDSPDDFAGAESPGIEVTLDAGSYSVTESGPAGYAASYSADCSGTIANGETKTCTVTNDDIAPKLTVIKHVITDNGGTAVAANFTLDSGGANDTPDNFAGSETGTVVTLDAGAYDVTESGPGGYTASFSADCDGTLAVGDEKTCIVTNDDQPGTLIVNKVLTQDNGGTDPVTSFSYTINGGSSVAFESDASNSHTVNAGTYSVVENAAPGYTTTYSYCSNIVVPNGGTKTCTITNNDQPGRLIVKKVLRTPIGTHTFQSFSFKINDGSSLNFESDGQNEYAVNAGIFNIVENPFSGYVTSYDNCSNVSVSLGETETCTITNVYKTGFVTNSSLCTFDVDDNPANGSQFRLLYTPDNSLSLYKLNASNPGQYYYNVLHFNDGTPAGSSLTMKIPYPFVTHGATPIHVYDDVSTASSDGQTCLTPIGELANQRDQITLATYSSQTLGLQTSVTVNNLPAGFSYVNIHLDYGLKKTTGYAKSSILGNSCVNDADQTIVAALTPDVPDCQDYTFENGGTHTVQSINVFKKNPGVGGLNLRLDEMPVRNAPMELRNTKGQLIAPQQLTDEDGWYFINYKHTGKAQDFILKWVGTPYQKTVTLKANAMAQVDFP